MNKVLAALAVGALTAVTACGVSACGGDKTVYTVTKTEWKEAISVFCPDGEDWNDLTETNFLCRMEGETEDGETAMSSYINMDYPSNCFNVEYDYGGGNIAAYFWKAEEGVYGGYPDDGVRILHETEDVFADYIISNISQLAAGGILFEYKVKSKYSTFAYDEHAKSYKAAYEVDGEEFSAELKFENGRLVRLGVVVDGVDAVYTYEYGTSCALPDKVKNLPLKEN